MAAETPRLPMAYQPGARFACHRCTACCRGPEGIELEPDDEERIAAHRWEQEHPRFETGWRVEPATPGALPRLRVHEGACIFLDPEGTCAIERRLGYASKPLRCRAFPLLFSQLGPERRATVSVACRSLYRSLENAPPLVPQPEHERMAETLPGLTLIGSTVVLTTDGRQTLEREEAIALLDECTGLADSDRALVTLPHTLGAALRRVLDPVPPPPWRIEGPEGTAFSAVLKELSEQLSAPAHGRGLSLLAAGMAALRPWRSWEAVCEALDPAAHRMAHYSLASLLFEGRPLVVGYLGAGIGLCLYLTMAATAGAHRLLELSARSAAPGRTDPPAAAVNRVAAEALTFLRWREGVELARGIALLFERLLLDAPAPAPTGRALRGLTPPPSR